MANIAKREDGRWRPRYRDAGGREHARHFTRKVDAQRWLNETTASIVTGRYIDPKAGRITFRDFAEGWRAAQVHRPGTVAQVEGVLLRHVYPFLGDRPLSSILPSDIQAMVKKHSMSLQPSTVGVNHRIVSAIFKAAVKDRRIPNNPCTGTRLPKTAKRKVQPIDTPDLLRIVELITPRIRALILVAAGTGLRQGELFGLTVDRLDMEARLLTVDRQMINVAGRQPFFAPPKTASSVRIIPLPQVVVDALTEHLRVYPTSGLVFTNTDGQPLRRSAFWTAWRRATRKAGLPDFRFHDLRHYYASLLIRHGESVKTVQARLGHANAAETLDTYSHLWPDSDDRTRLAVDQVLANLADYLRTSETAQKHDRRSGA